MVRLRYAAALPLMILAVLGICWSSPRDPSEDPAVAPLIKVLKDTGQSSDAKGEACQKLMELGPRAKAAVPVLIDLLSAKDEILRDYAVTTLRKIGPAAKSALPALKRVAQDDPSTGIRELAGGAVRDISAGNGTDAQSLPAMSVRDEINNSSATPPVRSDSARTSIPPSASIGPVDAGTVSALAPEALRAPAPTWVKPGLRLTYYTASASVPGSGKDWRPDEFGNMQTADGRRWSGTDKAGTSGHGYSHFDMTAVPTGAVAIAVSIYTMVGNEGPPMLMGQSAIVGAPGAAGDLWIHPEALKRLSNRVTSGLKIARMPYKIGEQARPAVWIQQSSAKGFNLFVYEEATGLLLHSASSTVGPPPNVRAETEISNTANTLLTSGTLVAQRMLSIPWAADPVPDWVDHLQAMQYDGTVTNQIPGSPPLNLTCMLSLTRTSRGAGWVRFAAASTVSGAMGAPPMSSRAESLSGQSQLGGAWIPPQGLARLQPGQELDRDPLTRVITAVGRPGRAPGGGDTVVLTQNGPAQQIEFGYDRASGRLLYTNKTERFASGFTQALLQTRLRLRELR